MNKMWIREVAVGTKGIRWQNQRDTVNKINKMAPEREESWRNYLEMLAQLKVRIRWWCSKAGEKTQTEESVWGRLYHKQNS